MAVIVTPEKARAVALFNPTAPGPGFLQPILSGVGGDNCTYVQLFTAPQILQGFIDIAWPDRDFVNLQEEAILEVGGETLWAFRMPDDETIVAPWLEFRELMRFYVEDHRLSDRPLLLFDIVDTLDLVDARRDVFTRAYRSYFAMGAETAARWRDRAILEPALVRQMSPGYGVSSEPDSDGYLERRNFPLRVRTDERSIKVETEQYIDSTQLLRLQEAYELLAEEMPEIFPAARKVVAENLPRKPARVFAEPIAFRIVLVGRLQANFPEFVGTVSEDIEVVPSHHFHPKLRTGRAPRLTIILGAQADWPDMVETSMAVGENPAMVLSLSSSTVPLLRDLEFQSRVELPTITQFAPYASSPRAGRDPVAIIRPVLDILRYEMEQNPANFLRDLLLAQHNMLVRETLWADSDLVETSCRLAAKALKSGAEIDGLARIYTEGGGMLGNGHGWTEVLGDMFRLDTSRPARTKDRGSRLQLLVERLAHGQPADEPLRQREGVQRLFRMRGWRVRPGAGTSFEVEAEDRRFSVVLVDSRKDIPAESPGFPAPGFTRSPVLVIHWKSKKDDLLTGNRGQFFHATPEDISLMVPGEFWVWSVLRRQMFENRPSTSNAALRLAASLVSEANRMGRTDVSLPDDQYSRILEGLAVEDSNRFLTYGQDDRADPSVLFYRTGEGLKGRSFAAKIELKIADDGPIASITEASEFDGIWG